jgi:hypothetical protein
VWSIGTWAIRKAKEMLKKNDGSWLQIRINPDEPNEIVISASNRGAWKNEKLPTNARALPPPSHSTPKPSKKRKRKARKK